MSVILVLFSYPSKQFLNMNIFIQTRSIQPKVVQQKLEYKLENGPDYELQRRFSNLLIWRSKKRLGKKQLKPHTAVYVGPSNIYSRDRCYKDLQTRLLYYSTYDPDHNMRLDFCTEALNWHSKQIIINLTAPLLCEVLYGSPELTFKTNYNQYFSPHPPCEVLAYRRSCYFTSFPISIEWRKSVRVI